MHSFREVVLPSGATLKIQPAPFAEAKALYQAVLEDMILPAKFSSGTEISILLKDILASGFASKKIEHALSACLSKCIYSGPRGDLRIDKDTFEPLEAREDYVQVCLEVAQENLSPFMKGLYAVYSILPSMLAAAQK